MLKKVTISLYTMLLIVMAAATIIEKIKGTDFAATAIYGSWWFTVLWALLAAAGAAYILRRRVRHFPTLLLHFSFLVILAGALITHLCARQGMVDLRMGETTATFYVKDSRSGITEERLPFKMRLNKFDTKYHTGTNAAADYETEFTVIDGQQMIPARVSMNKIFTYRGVRFYQASYDDDGQGSVLTVNSDPWGIAVTYTGYGLLFFALIYMLFDPKGAYRRALRSPLLKKGTLVALMLIVLAPAHGNAQRVLPRQTAEAFGRLYILYNGRICPVKTYASDFCKKINGHRSYLGLTPEQVLTGYIFYYSDWCREPFIKVKNGELKNDLKLGDYCALNDLFSPMAANGYALSRYLEDYYSGQNDEEHRQAADLDNKVMLLMQLREQSSLKMLPYTEKNGATTWYAPTDTLPKSIEPQQALYINRVFHLMAEDAQAGAFDRIDAFISKMGRYQKRCGGSSLPSPTQYKAEIINDSVPFATILFIVNITLGFITLFFFIYRLTTDSQRHSCTRAVMLWRGWHFVFAVILILSFLTLTAALAIRWIISGTIPMANGYETMLTVAWIVQLIAIIMQQRFRIVMVFGFLLSGFFLLVSHLGQMDPAIGQVMPVLNSPLLSIHVSIIMMSYALLSLTFICGLLGLFLPSRAAELQALSRVFLYPAISALGIGIFVGAIWANVSWGTYWSWDSKETWALITFMLYAAAIHTESLPALNRPRNYHLYLVLAFLSIIMTYFGVNYFLTGMHSYA